MLARWCTLLLFFAASVSHAAQALTVGFEPSEGYSVGSIAGQPDGGANRWSVASASYVQGVTTAAAHSGTQSFLITNQNANGAVLSLSFRCFTPVGEPGSSDGIGQVVPPGVNRVRYSFWFRTVAASNDSSAMMFGLDNGGGGRLVINTFTEQGSSVRIAQQFGGSLTTVSIGAWHQLTMDCTMLTGNGNDTCSMTLDTGAPIAASTFENYYYTNSVTVPAASSLIFSMDLITSSTGQGFYVDDVLVTPMYADGGVYVPPVDAGVDGGAGSPDGGTSSDGGTSADAGTSDAGAADAGEADGGVSEDAGASDGGVDGDTDGGDIGDPLGPAHLRAGCGCSATGSLSVLAALLFLSALRRRSNTEQSA